MLLWRMSGDLGSKGAWMNPPRQAEHKSRLRADKGLMWPMGEPEEKMERGMWCKTLGAMLATFALDLETLSQLVGDF